MLYDIFGCVELILLGLVQRVKGVAPWPTLAEALLGVSAQDDKVRTPNVGDLATVPLNHACKGLTTCVLRGLADDEEAHLVEDDALWVGRHLHASDQGGDDVLEAPALRKERMPEVELFDGPPPLEEHLVGLLAFVFR